MRGLLLWGLIVGLIAGAARNRDTAHVRCPEIAVDTVVSVEAADSLAHAWKHLRSRSCTAGWR